MGSFNLACKATNTVIKPGSPVVAYTIKPFTEQTGRHGPGSLLVPTHFVSGGPIYGTMNDCGNINTTDETVFEGKNHMIFHRVAHDHIKETSIKEIEDWSDVLKDESSEMIENYLSVAKLYKESDNPDNLEMLERVKRVTLRCIFQQSEGREAATDHWAEVALAVDDDELLSYVEKNKENCGWIETAEAIFHFHTGPSLYAGQEPDGDAVRFLHKIALNVGL